VPLHTPRRTPMVRLFEFMPRLSLSLSHVVNKNLPRIFCFQITFRKFFVDHTVSCLTFDLTFTVTGVWVKFLFVLRIPEAYWPRSRLTQKLQETEGFRFFARRGKGRRFMVRQFNQAGFQHHHTRWVEVEQLRDKIQYLQGDRLIPRCEGIAT
jgi:hypothetical protein